MSYSAWSRFVTFFHAVCWTAAFALVTYWVYVFIQNDDLCVVDYRKYYETESDVFPMLTICLKNPISVEKMKTQASGINQTAYLQFLNGKVFDSEMLSTHNLRFCKVIKIASKILYQCRFMKLLA